MLRQSLDDLDFHLLFPVALVSAFPLFIGYRPLAIIGWAFTWIVACLASFLLGKTRRKILTNIVFYTLWYCVIAVIWVLIWGTHGGPLPPVPPK